MSNQYISQVVKSCFFICCFFLVFLDAYDLFADNTASSQEKEPISPVTVHSDLDPAKVALGEKLFHEPRLSKNNRISCASCHSLEKGGTDNLQFSLGLSGIPTKVNAPTVFNVADHFIFFWDGSAESLEEQIDGPLNHPNEMGTNWRQVEQKLLHDPEYKKLFHITYNTKPTEKAIKDAIVTYERSLNTPNAPFDKYLMGDKNAISEQAKAGYMYFKSFGCASCHQGQNVGGNMYQTFGVVGDYFKDRGTPITEADLGRYNITGEEWDKHVFKVPSLRNIELTAPYFHDGSAETLEEAVDIMVKYQLGRNLSKEEKTAIIEFLKSLTGEYKGRKLNEE